MDQDGLFDALHIASGGSHHDGGHALRGLEGARHRETTSSDRRPHMAIDAQQRTSCFFQAVLLYCTSNAALTTVQPFSKEVVPVVCDGLLSTLDGSVF